MFNEYKKKLPGQDAISAREYNLMQRVLRNLMKSMGVNSVMCSSGLHFRRVPVVADSVEIFVAKVDSEQEGGGYYNCYLQKLNAGDNWNTDDADVFVDENETVIVLNLNEHNSDSHDLSHNDGIICWKTKDEATINSQGNVYIGIPIEPETQNIKKASVVSVGNTFYTLNINEEHHNAGVFYQGQKDFNLATNVIPLFKVGDWLPYYKIGSSYYINQTFTYVGNNRSIRWVDDDGFVDDPYRAGAFFRDF